MRFVSLTRGVALAGAVTALALSAPGCKKSSHATTAAPTGECSACHGGTADSAPPRATNGATATTDLRVGAHQSHLGPGPFRKPISCAECHVVPSSVNAPGHQNGTADVVFDATRLARAQGAVARWNPATATCTTYCHGATLDGGTHTTTTWNVVDGSQVQCGSCHGEPPAMAGHPRAPHPAVSGPIPASCSPCHPGTVTSDGKLVIGGGQHIDGVVQIGGLACTGCHGDPTRLPASISPAPPRDSHGATATTDRGVGAHAQHLAGTTLSRTPVDCGECHDTRDTMSRHPDGAVDLAFGPLARGGGAAASWNPATTTCVTYCHGATLAGGTAKQPVWTKVDGTQVGCASCHGAPPPLPHSQDTACGKCHLGYTSTTVNKTLHLNGYIELDLKTCASCHGDASRPPALQPAPPTDLAGDTSTSARGVGAHQAHLTGNTLAAPLTCTECHPSFAKTNHATGQHLVRELEFGPLATTGGTFPTWDRTTMTCASTYCHGATLRGGSAQTPVWNRVDGSQKRCDSCHGIPPSSPHPNRLDCGTCHPGYTSTAVVVATHIDGVVQADSAACTSCHGDANRKPATTAAAPPFDLAAEFWTTARGVGAHQRHLVASNLSRAVACSECHVVPTTMAHANGVVDVTFGPLAVTSATPVWSGGRCSNVYCHGSTLSGGTITAPLWTRVDGSQASCGTCHGVPPPAPHTQSKDCGACHSGYTAASVNLAKHIDGVVQATGGCTTCHGDPAAPVTDTFAAAPPRDTQGNTATTALGVGAHRAHVESTPLRVGLACTECHPATNAATHPEGTLVVTFGPLASGGGVTPVWTRTTASCATVYCHGAPAKGGAATTPVWTQVDGTFAACNACHGVPPPSHASYAGNTQCGTCHQGYTSTTVDPKTHVDGTVNATGNGSCSSCHGEGARTGASSTAPPKDHLGNTSTSSRGVGAHQVHLEGGPLRAGIACSECHVSPPASPHPSNAVELAFGTLASTGTTATWNTTSLTCTNYCHGATLGGGTKKNPVWNTVNGTQAACGTCHGIPPPSPHVQSMSCGNCHAGSTATSVDPATHVDGQVQSLPLSCTSCHGDPARVLVTGADARAKSAPPVDTNGRSGTTLRSVGVHLAHLNKGTGAIAAPTSCSECHVVPSSNTHADGAATVTFGSKAKTNGAAPTWNGSTCSNTYCHGSKNLVSGIEFGSNGTPSWTSSGTLSCAGACHAAKPNDAFHTTFQHEAANGACNGCHKSVNAAGTAIVNPALHVNGVVDGLCSQCHRGKTP